MAARSSAPRVIASKPAGAEQGDQSLLELPLSSYGEVGDAGALRHYDDPAYYDKTYRSRRHDVEYYVHLARELGGPVLEYGIGSGRVALPLAREGIEVSGIDLSGPMLARLQQALLTESAGTRARVKTKQGDMRSVRLKRRFPLVIAPFNVMLHLYQRRDMEAFLTRVREHLLPKAWFVFDFSVPNPEDLCVDPTRYFGAPRFRHPQTGELTRYAERFEYDRLRQILFCSMKFSPESAALPSYEVPFTHRQFFPQEMEALLYYNGFEEQIWSADFSDAPADSSVDSLVVRCRPASRRGRTAGTGGRRQTTPQKAR